jgi:hypothetical protein
MKWWGMVRVRGVKERSGGLPRGELTVISSVPRQVMLLRNICANDVQPRSSITPGNIWMKGRVGEEWNYGNWKWDPRWK